MAKGVRELLQASIDPLGTRVVGRPNLILVFGGPLGDGREKSARQMFLDWIKKNHKDLSQSMITAENCKDWNNFAGYANLIDFERDVVCLSRAVVLFLESPGSIAELGAFCMDPQFSEGLFVIIGEDYYNAFSFISQGPVKKIEGDDEESVCTVKDIKTKAIEHEFSQIVESLESKLKKAPKSLKFEPQTTRHQILLIADLIELFGALTVNEIVDLCELLGLKTTVPKVKHLYALLFRFGIVTTKKKNTTLYYLPTKHRLQFLDYQSIDKNKKFDRLRFKTKVSTPWIKDNVGRYSAYRDVHGTLG
jgi:hypothetical protein